MIIAFINMIFTPYYYAFFPQFKTSKEELITKLITVIFYIADIMVNFRTTYIDEIGVEIWDINKIKYEYIHSTLVFDLIAIIPWEYIFI
jgi:hypothetical protein